MKHVMPLLLTAMLLAPWTGDGEDYTPLDYTPMLAEHNQEWRQCQSDDQCTTIVTTVCSFMLPVNKKYSDQATEFASRRAECNIGPQYDEGTVAKCFKNECELWTPPQFRGLMGMHIPKKDND